MTKEEFVKNNRGINDNADLPLELLSDIYDEITTDADEYYLFGAEERILKAHADEIVGIMNARPDGSAAPNGVVLELGAG